MKSIKIFYLTAIAILAGLFTACENKDFEAGPAADGAQVYFPNDFNTSFSVGDDISSISIPVNRIEKEEALTINILANDESALFNIPSAVSFNAGESKTSFDITFDRTKLVDGTDYPIELLLNDDENTTTYGESRLSIVVTPWPWELVGTGKLRDDFFSSMFDWNSFAEVDVNIHKHKTQKGIYMLENPWGPEMLAELLDMTAEEIAAAGYCRDANVTIDCSDPNDVFIPLQEVGVNVNDEYGWIMIGTVEGGTLEEGVITFPKGGLAMRFPDYEGGSNFPVNREGMFRILFPGAEVTDYSLAVKYDGMKVEADGETASAIIDFTYGADVTGIHYAVATGSLSDENIATVEASIIDGTAQNINKINKLSTDTDKVSEQLALSNQGAYTIVAVALDVNGHPTAKGIATAKFYFPGATGGSAPECELAVGMGLVSQYWEEMSEQCPDISSLYYEVQGSELESIFVYLDLTDSVNGYKANGFTEEQIIDALGTDFTERMVASINAKGFYGSAWINRRSDSSYTMIVKATNIYGKSKVVSASYSTTAIPYTGDLVLGNYVMHFDAPANDGSTIPCDNYIKVVPQAEGNNTDFFVYDFGLEIEVNSWYAKYDATASTLTLSGVIEGFEQHGNMFDGWIAFSDSEAERIRSFNASDENSKGDDPVVIKIDPATKKLESLENDILVYLGSVNGTSVSNPQLSALYYADGTTFTHESAATAAAPKTLKKQSRSAKVPFSSVRIPADSQKKAIFADNAVAKNISENITGIRTVSVNAQACEPLQKAISRKAIGTNAATFNALR